MKKCLFYQAIHKKLDREELDNINEIIIKKLSIHGLSIDNLIYVGSGNNGVAYASSNKVVKLTKDKNEVEIAIKLQGKKNINLVNIDEVIQLNDEFYLIIQERVDTKSDDLKKCQIFILDFFQDGYFDFEDIILYEEMKDVLDLNENTFLGKKCDNFNINFIKCAFLAYKELKDKTGISSSDFHVFNSGIRRNGSIVFFDQRGNY